MPSTVGGYREFHINLSFFSSHSRGATFNSPKDDFYYRINLFHLFQATEKKPLFCRQKGTWIAGEYFEYFSFLLFLKSHTSGISFHLLYWRNCDQSQDDKS